MNKQKIITTMLILLAAAMQGLQAQGASNQFPVSGWYVGMEGGAPFSFSTFSSFGDDKVHAGNDIGIYGGYRLNPVLSAELSMKWGKTALSARKCCIASGYLLGADGVCYYAPVAGMSGWNYADLKSSVAMQHYGVRLNVNLIGIFELTKHSRWTLELSPELASVGTKASVRTIADGIEVRKGTVKWHLGTGGSLQVGYALTRKLNVGIYSNIFHLTGCGMDGLPKQLHKTNFIWESGVRIGWTFGKNHASKQFSVQHIIVPETVAQPIKTTETHTKVTVCPEESVHDTLISGMSVQPLPVLAFPTIYFAFNRTDIDRNETVKLEEIKKLLQTHPDVQILVTGWCDKSGTVAVNDRISLRRAETVKTWLVEHGIAAKRIQVRGGGIDYSEPNRRKARRATTEREEKEARP